MTPVTDEPMIRAALADLTSEQPPQPSGRFQTVRQRAIRQRRHQLAGAAVSALALAGIAVGLTRLSPVVQHQPQARAVPSWALPWPDYRNGSVPQSVLDNAVLAWGDQAQYITGSVAPSSPRQIARLAASYHVVWYVGQTIARGQEVAVMFEASSPATGPVLVVGYADASSVLTGQPAFSGGGSPWILSSTAAPAHPRTFGPGISEYVDTVPASGNGADNWIVVLTAPGGELTSWTAVGASGRTETSAVAAAGLYVHNVGQLKSAVMLDFGQWREFAPVGIGPAVPTLVSPPALTPPASFHEIAGVIGGQGNQGGLDDLSFVLSAGPYAVVADCANAPPVGYGMANPGQSGHGPARVMINGHDIGAITCDGNQHEIAIPRAALRRHEIMITMASSNLTSWQIDFGRLK